MKKSIKHILLFLLAAWCLLILIYITLAISAISFFLPHKRDKDVDEPTADGHVDGNAHNIVGLRNNGSS